MEEIQFNWKGYFKPTPKNIQKFSLAMKGIVATTATSSYVAGNDKLTLILLVVGAGLNEISNFFTE